MKTKCPKYSIIFLIFFSVLFACDDFVKIDPPRTALVKATVFDSDATANATALDMYWQLRTSAFANDGLFSISYLLSLYSDEQTNYYSSGTASSNAYFQQFNDNALAPNNPYVLRLWSDLYKCIYKANAIIEGLAASKGVTESKRKLLEGEAKFFRAFCHFYLVNLWGDVPLVLTTDYRINSEMARTTVPEIYNQIIADLIDAQELLKEDFSLSNNERVRVNRGAATALLARTYLYSHDWANAEAQSTMIISNTSLYGLVTDLKDITTKNNTEAIWQLWSDYYPQGIFTFYIFSSPGYGALREELTDDFELDDQRRVKWVGSVVSNGNTYFFSTKHSSFVIAAEYSTILRLGEQYLIRAEARAQLNNIPGAQADLNVIRHRAGLPDTPADSKQSLLNAIEGERRFELFNEWGHRWFDIRRTNRADAVLISIKPQWVSTAVLFPIPESEMINNASLKHDQNEGY